MPTKIDSRPQDLPSPLANSFAPANKARREAEGRLISYHPPSNSIAAKERLLQRRRTGCDEKALCGTAAVRMETEAVERPSAGTGPSPTNTRAIVGANDG